MHNYHLKNMKKIRNLALAAALIASLTASALDLPRKVVNGKEYYYYEVPPKMTIYSMTKLFNVTREKILQYNPQVKDGLKAGDIIYLPVEGEQSLTKKVTSTTPIVTSVATTNSSVSTPMAQVSTAAAAPTAPSVPAEQSMSKLVPSQINVAVLLPFNLKSKSRNRQTLNNLDFYRGMLMAVDSLSATSGVKVNLLIEDTEGVSDYDALFASKPKINEANYIIAPADSAALESIAAIADANHSTVVNIFTVKNSAQMRHPSVVQTNIPHDEMYETAISGFCNQYAGNRVVILNPTDAEANKREFVEMLVKELDANNIPHMQVDYEMALTDNATEEIPTDKGVVFVPTTSVQSQLMKVIPAIDRFMDARPENAVQLFGYPEWVALPAETIERLHRLNTTVYSRFSTDVDNANRQAVKNLYKRTYKRDITKTVPNYVLLGYDTAAWLMSAAKLGISAPYSGVQNVFEIRDLTDPEGYVNTGLFFITFSPSGQVNANVL